MPRVRITAEGQWSIPFSWAPVEKVPEDRANLPRAVPDDAWLTLRTHPDLGRPHQQMLVVWLLDGDVHQLVCDGWAERGSELADGDGEATLVSHQRFTKADIARKDIEMPHIEKCWLETRDGRHLDGEGLPFLLLLDWGVV